jgi:hypothetical protein
VEVVRDQVAGETVRGGKGGDGRCSVHFIADAVMVEMARGGGGGPVRARVRRWGSRASSGAVEAGVVGQCGPA